MKIICPNCGNEVDDENKFCDICGYKIGKSCLEGFIQASDNNLSLTSIIFSLLTAGIIFFIFSFICFIAADSDMSIILYTISAFASAFIGGLILGYLCGNWNKSKGNLIITIGGFISCLLLGSGAMFGIGIKSIQAVNSQVEAINSNLNSAGFNSLNTSAGSYASSSIESSSSNLLIEIILVLVLIIALYSVGTYIGAYLKNNE